MATLLVTEAGKHKAVKQALQLALEADQGSDSLAAGITQRLISIGRSQSRLSTNKGREMVAELEQLRSSIVTDVASSDPAEALSLMWQLIDLHGSLIERTRDRARRLGAFFASAVPDLPDLATQAKSDIEQLASNVFQHFVDDRYGVYDELILIMAEPLGETGLALLQEKFTAAHKKHLSQGRRSASRDAEILQTGLRAVADTVGDVDAFLETFSPEELQHPALAVQIAMRLVDNGRSTEAMAMLDHAVPDSDDDPHSRILWATVRSSALKELGRTDELKALHLETFETFLSPDHLRAYLKLLPDFDDVEAEEKALDWVAGHRAFLPALLFLISWPALPRANHLVTERTAEIDGSYYDLLLPAAEALDGRFPLAGILIRRSLIDFSLKLHRGHRFKQIMQHVKELEALDASVVDYSEHDDHQAFMERLWLDHPHKAGFWALLEA